eukprot:TRINITY_DN9391_c0_g1_i1.p1 TRINITY_DN9391_c0_g1~~TRINITY_DN9391_c0_g1_i1.p1  ORF type:complete len:833 (-),score=301.79 TRINITY_DN9391_c0_g1_i1:127-2625(-)
MGVYFPSLPTDFWDTGPALTRGQGMFAHLAKSTIDRHEVYKILELMMQLQANFDAKFDSITADTAKAMKLLIPESPIKWSEIETAAMQIRELQLRYHTNLANCEAELPIDEARTLFDQLDKDKTGFLQSTEEVAAFSNWVYTRASPGGEPIPAHHVAQFTQMVLDDVDNDGDCVISFEEFKTYFEKKAAAKRLSQKLVEQVGVSEAPTKKPRRKGHVFHSLPDAPEIDDVHLAMVQKRFSEVDTDHDMLVSNSDLEQIVRLFLGVIAKENATKDEIDEDVAAALKMSRQFGKTLKQSLSFKELKDLFQAITHGRLTYTKAIVQELASMPISAARRKFDELDTDNSGYLEAPEFEALGRWAFDGFMVDGELLGDTEIKIESDKLIQEIDADSDNRISFEEFERWYLGKAATLADLSDRIQAPAIRAQSDPILGAIAYPSLEVLSEARIKFDELDADKSEVLEGAELAELSKFVLSRVARETSTEQQLQADVNLMMQQVPADKVTWPEFEALWNKMMRMQLENEEALGQNKPKMSEAMKKFKELDADNSEFLDGAEFKELAQWAFSTLRISGKPMTEDELEMATTKMLQEIDANGDKKISFAEFEKFWESRSTKLDQIQCDLKKMRDNSNPPVLPDLPPAEEVLSAVRRAWIELESDNNGFLEGTELEKLVEFVSFVLTQKLTSNIKADAGVSGEEIVRQNAAALRATLPVTDKISYPEFEEFYNKLQLHQLSYEKKVMEAVLKEAPPLSQARLKFDELDVDKTGLLEADELTEMCEWFFGKLSIDGRKLDQATIALEGKSMITKFDDGDGKISFEEFETVSYTHLTLPTKRIV